jgi:fructose-bisphosphate aldolase / 6-deoxy-5-ketofructose 1-phosphate synthase
MAFLNFIIPADVPPAAREEFVKNYNAITQQTGNLLLFAGDQKMEHLNTDFYGPNIPEEVNNPEHLFSIASKGNIGAFATQFGLITRYAQQFPTVNYIAKLNGKTNLIPLQQQDPFSQLLWYVEDVVEAKQHNNLNIRGIGFTLYLGSKYEPDMLTQASQAIYHAHQFGLVAILWVYPRGTNVTNEKDANLIAGAAGVAACLGADFVKLNVPDGKDSITRAQALRQAVVAAGDTKVICAGGPKTDRTTMLQEVRDLMTIAGTAGCAIGRNIYQQSAADAIVTTQALADIVFGPKYDVLENTKRY